MKKLRFYLFILGLILSQVSFAQKAETDSFLVDTVKVIQLIKESQALMDQQKQDEALKKLESAKELFEGHHSLEHFALLSELYENISWVYKSKQQYKLAYENSAKALEFMIPISNQDSLYVDKILLDLGVYAFYVGKVNYALECTNRALLIRKKKYGSNHLELALPFNNLGLFYSAQGLFKESIKSFKEALILSRAALDSLDIARVSNNIGSIYAQSGEIDSALLYMKNSIGIREKKLGKNSAILAPSLLNLALLSMEKGDLRTSFTFLLRGENILLAQKEPDFLHLGAIYTGFGNQYHHLSDYKNTILYYQKALETFSKSIGLEFQSIIPIYQNLSECHYQLGNKKEKAYYDKKAKSLIEKLYSEDHSSMAHYFNALSHDNFDNKDYDSAIKNLLKAIEITKLTENQSSLGSFYNNISLCYSKSNRFNEALHYMQLALEEDKRAYGLQNLNTAETLVDFGDVYFRMSDFTNSLEYYSTAQQISDSLAYAYGSELTDYEALYNIQYKKGRALLELFKQSGRLEDLLSAEKAFKNAHYSFNAYQTKILNKEVNSADFSITGDMALLISEKIIHSNMFISKETNKPQSVDTLFKYSEFYKSMLLRRAFKESEALRFANIPDSLLTREYDLRVDLNYNEKKRQEKIDAGLSPTDTTVLAYSSRLFDLHQQYDTLKAHFEQKYPEYYRLKYDLSVVTVDTVQQKLLQPDQTLLEYFVGDSSIFAFVVNKNDFQVREIKKDFQLEKMVQQLRKGIYARLAGSTDPADSLYVRSADYSNQQYTEAAQQLYLKLIAPLDSHLQKRLIIIPDGVLGYIPFQTLLKTKPALPHRFHSHDYLGNSYSISYCYSATLLREMMDKKFKKALTKPLLAVAPYFDGSMFLLDSLYKAELDSLQLGDLAVNTRSNAFNTLKHSGEEVYKTSKIWRGEYLLNQQATEEQFVQKAGDYRILHLATHGKANDEVGDYSYLAFTEIEDSLENEKLFVKDLYNLQLNADMVVLSACETGIGELQRGEGIVSLARAFAYAGAKSIFTTLWSVDDSRTKTLMVNFHKALKKGLSKDLALQKAQVDFLAKFKGMEAHPFYWAPFIGIGDMRKL